METVLTCQDESKTLIKTPTNFFDLPGELRNIIYELVLVSDIPVELASIWVGHRACQAYRKGIEDLGDHWSLQRYYQEVQPSLSLLRVSKQINEEASPIYYGQDFRFTNQSGWHILYHWLVLIGDKNRAMVRHITVGYTGMTRILDKGMRREPWIGRAPLELDLGQSPVPTGFPELADECMSKREGVRELCGWAKISDPTHMLISMPQLHTLRLAIFYRHYNPIEFQAHLRHAVHFAKFTALLKAQVSVVNLVAGLEERQRRPCCYSREMRLNFVYDDDARP